MPGNYVAVILLDLAVIIAAGSALAVVAVRFGQPGVIGEIVAGILLGPTLLGALPGHLTTRLFPLSDRPLLTTLADVGLVLFMFSVGYEVDHAQLRRIRSAAAVVSLCSVAIPFLLGIGLATLLYPSNHVVNGHSVSRLAFVLFFGVATSITAFPVLARILTALNVQRSQLGTFVMTCAAGADVVAWAVLALVVAVATDAAGPHSGGVLGPHPFVVIGEMTVFVVVLTFVVRPLIRAFLGTRLVARSHWPLLVIVVGLMLSAWFTTWLGFQPIFGAFAFGATMPRNAVREVAPEVPLLVEQASQILVPVFFVTTGLSVNLSALGAWGYLEALMVTAVACAGKFGGAAGSALLFGFDRRRASAIGVLMNSRGLTELIVLQVGITLGILNERLASIMVIMAVLTTMAATPLFRALYNGRLQREDDEQLQAVAMYVPAPGQRSGAVDRGSLR